MINSLLSLKNIKLKVDESDALAIAICHLFRLKNVRSSKNSWKAFIEAFPHRVIGQ
jgi:crossover junction endodeoxyribonuclease RuvC